MDEPMPSWSEFLKQVEQENNSLDSIEPEVARLKKTRKVSHPIETEEQLVKKRKREEESNSRRMKMLEDMKARKSNLKAHVNDGLILDVVLADKENFVNNNPETEIIRKEDSKKCKIDEHARTSKEDASDLKASSSVVSTTSLNFDMIEEDTQPDPIENALSDNDKPIDERVDTEETHPIDEGVNTEETYPTDEGVDTEETHPIDEGVNAEETHPIGTIPHEESNVSIDEEMEQDSLNIQETSIEEEEDVRETIAKPKLMEIHQVENGILLTPVRRAKLRKKREDNLRDMRERIKKFEGPKFESTTVLKESRFKISKPFISKANDIQPPKRIAEKLIDYKPTDECKTKASEAMEALRQKFMQDFSNMLTEYTDRMTAHMEDSQDTSVVQKFKESEDLCRDLENQVKELTKELNILKAKTILQDNKITNLQDQLNIKTDENTKLTQICDELLASLESGQSST